MISKLKRLKSNRGFIRYFNNTSWMMGEQLLRIFAGLFVGVWIARYLGPEQFGLFSYVLAFTAIFGGIARLGLDGIVTRELVNHPEHRDQYLGTSFWLKVLGAMIVLILLLIVAPVTNNDSTTNLYIFIVTFALIFQSFQVVEFYFQSLVQAKVVSICKVIQLALSSIIKIYLVLIDSELVWFVAMAVFDAVSLALCFIIAYRIKQKSAFFSHFDLAIAKQLLKESWPLIFSSIVIMIYMRIDQIMIKEMLGEYDVGIYSAALRLSEAFYFIPTLVSASLFPAILNAKKKSEALYKYRLQRLYTLMVWLAVAIVVAIICGGDRLVFLLYGHTYQDASQVLMIHAWASIFVFLGVASSKWFVAENQQVLSFWRVFSGMCMNGLLNFYLIPQFGLKGAAVATLISQAMATYLFDLAHHKTREMFVMKTKSLTGLDLLFTWR